MLQRLLSSMGLTPHLPSSFPTSSGPGPGDGLETEGQASIAFVPGQKIAPAAQDEDVRDERQTHVDRDLVWPGRTETITIANPAVRAYRYDLTVTDLPPSLYMRRLPQGGAWQSEGGVLLQPGEEASFEVVFVPPTATEKARTRTFSFVLTRFDPRRGADPGEIVEDLPLRWVALPAEGDLQIRANMPQVVIRPWRRNAMFQVHLQNKSFLPPSVELEIVRAGTREALVKEPEPVGSLSQSVPARTPGVWHCLLPPAPQFGSYLATVKGTACVAGREVHPLSLPRPVLVRYIPWLRQGRDWAFLVGMLLFLVWLVWGVPVRKQPTVRMSLLFAGLDRDQVPEGSRLGDLKAEIVLLDAQGNEVPGQPHLTGVVQGNVFEFQGPAGWYGYRWPFGWTRLSRVPQHFRVDLTPKEDKQAAFHRYDFTSLSSDDSDATASYSVTEGQSVLDGWIKTIGVIVPRSDSAAVLLKLGNLDKVAPPSVQQVTVNCWLNGNAQPPKTCLIVRDATGELKPILLDYTDQVPPGSSVDFSVTATAPGVMTPNPAGLPVTRQSRPFLVTLTFAKVPQLPPPPITPPDTTTPPPDTTSPPTTTPPDTTTPPTATALHARPPHVTPPHTIPHVTPPHTAPINTTAHTAPPINTTPHAAPPINTTPHAAPPHVTPINTTPPHITPPYTPTRLTPAQANASFMALWRTRQKARTVTVAQTGRLLDHGANINARTPAGYTALLAASVWSNDDVVHLLLERGANVNARNKNGQTPLMYAALNGNAQMVQDLLEKHADVNARDKHGASVLAYAGGALTNKGQVIGLLTAAGAR